MKVRHKLHVLMAQKEIKSIKELTRQLKKYDYATLYNFSVYVHKKLDPQLIYDLCKFFNCSIEDLLYLEQEKEGA